MTEMVRKADVERMFLEAFQQGKADDPQLIPNLLNSLRLFCPTFDIPLHYTQVRGAEAVAQRNVDAMKRKVYG
jgi:hypothetical protein